MCIYYRVVRTTQDALRNTCPTRHTVFREVLEYFTNSVQQRCVCRDAHRVYYCVHQCSLDSIIRPLQISKYSPNSVPYNILCVCIQVCACAGESVFYITIRICVYRWLAEIGYLHYTATRTIIIVNQIIGNCIIVRPHRTTLCIHTRLY